MNTTDGKIIDNPQNIQSTDECIKSATYLTETKYYNICTGEEHSVPIGTGDYLCYGSIGLIFIVIVIAIIRTIIDSL